MKNLVIKKLIIIPYTLMCFSIGSNIVSSNGIGISEYVNGFYVSNIEVENNKKMLLEKPKLKHIKKKYF